MTDLLPGFADPVRDSQAVFRVVMDAMARPGRIGRVAAPLAPPPPLARATAAVLLTLIDGETPLWLDPRAAGAWDWVRFHCGAAPAEPEAAQFAVALDPLMPERLRLGSDEEPEDAATVILQVAGFGQGQALRLSGPGLAAESALTVEGLPPGFVGAWEANGRLFPRGVDVILCAGDELAALPRTVRIG